MENDDIKFDHAGFALRPRYTHVPSGETIVRAPWMNDAAWEVKKAAFFEAHDDG